VAVEEAFRLAPGPGAPREEVFMVHRRAFAGRKVNSNRTVITSVRPWTALPFHRSAPCKNCGSRAGIIRSLIHVDATSTVF
jgi:hypothetical protein